MYREHQVTETARDVLPGTNLSFRQLKNINKKEPGKFLSAFILDHCIMIVI